MKKISIIITIIGILILGLLIYLNSINIINLNMFFNGWWTLFIIIPSLSFLLASKDKTLSIIFLICGIFTFLTCNDLLDYKLIITFLLPVILIITLIVFIYNEFNKRKSNLPIECSVFGREYMKVNKKFNGAYLSSVFALFTYDLNESKISRDIVLDSTNLFGTTVILVPDNVNVIVKSINIFGKEHNYVKNKNSNKDTIFINSFNIFGGVDIR